MYSEEGEIEYKMKRNYKEKPLGNKGFNNKMVSQKGFEPLTLALEGRCSIQLSY